MAGFRDQPEVAGRLDSGDRSPKLRTQSAQEAVRKEPAEPKRQPDRKAASRNGKANYAPVGIPFVAARSDQSRVVGHAANTLRKTTPAYRRARAETGSGSVSRSSSCQDARTFRQESHRYSDSRGAPIYLRNPP